MKQPIGVDVIGVGILGSRHARVYSEQPTAKLVALAREGARIVACSRTFSDVEEVANQINDNGGDALALRCDVADPGQVEKAFQQAVARFGPIDILVNNAGVGTVAPYEVADYQIGTRSSFLFPPKFETR